VRTSPRLRIAAACVLSSLAAITATAPAEASRTDCTIESGWPAQNASLAAEVVRLVNAYRAQRGLSQVGVSQSLTNAAAWKASQLAVDVAAYGAGAFDHFDYGTNRSPQARLQACGYGSGFGENIAYGQPSPQAVMDAWIASDGHRRNLEYPGWRAIGVGAVQGSAGIGWVQDFGTDLPDPVATPSPNLSAPPTPAPSTPAPVTPLAPPPASPLVSAVTEAPAAGNPAAAAPDVQIVARPRVRTRKRTVRIAWTVTGSMTELSCSLDGRVLAGCTATGRTLRNIRRGRHTFQVNVAGPSGTDSQVIRWRVLRRR
jgi:uncharacterized protein YkwD